METNSTERTTMTNTFHASNPVNGLICAVAYPAWEKGNNEELGLVIRLVAKMTGKTWAQVAKIVLDAFRTFDEPERATYAATHKVLFN